MRQRRLFGFISVFRSSCSSPTTFLYKTWTFGSRNSSAFDNRWLPVILAFLSVSFVVASLLAFSQTNAPVRTLYRAAAVWMGFLSFLFAGCDSVVDHLRGSGSRRAQA